MGFLSTREQASLIVLAGLLAWLLTRKDLRAHIPELLKQLLSAALLLPFLAMFAYMSLEVWIGFQLGFWHEGLATATVIWAFVSGGVLLFKSASEAHENPFFFHATAAATIAPTVFVTFFMNLATLDLLSEVALQLLLFPVTIGSVVGHSLLGDSFHTRYGLPRGPGIKMKVAEDGQRWCAYRRTIGGWCFAIGAAGPPPGQWEYDGQDPPSGFPGEDPGWGDIPYREAVSRNWD